MFKLSDISNKQKKLLISNILLVLAAVLLIGGIVYLATDIYNRHKREDIIEEATSDMEQVIASNMAAIEAAGGDESSLAEPVMTLVVDPSELEVNDSSDKGTDSDDRESDFLEHFPIFALIEDERCNDCEDSGDNHEDSADPEQETCVFSIVKERHE